jgi:hypothetical protein
MWIDPRGSAALAGEDDPIIDIATMASNATATRRENLTIRIPPLLLSDDRVRQPGCVPCPHPPMRVFRH